MQTDYTAVYDRKPIKRGDTLDGFSVKLTMDDTGDAIVPESICMQLKSQTGRIVHTFDVQLFDESIRVRKVAGAVTAGWRAGTYKYDIEYRMSSGRVRTYLEGAITILEDVSKCPAP